MSPRTIGHIGILALALALRLGPGAVADLGYYLLACYALLGTSSAIRALAVAWFFGMISPAFTTVDLAGAVGRYAVLLGAAVSVLLRSGIGTRRLSINRTVGATLLLGLFLVLHSLFVSPIKDVSILKAISWTLTVATLLAGWSQLTKSERVSLETQIFYGLVFVLLASLPLLGSGVGYLRNGTGFQGVLNHPQAFGPTVALLGTWVTARILGMGRPPLGWVLLAGVCLILVVLSEARTAAFAWVLGCVGAIGTGQILNRKSLSSFLPGLLNKRVHLIIGVSLVIAILTGSALSDRVHSFIAKRTGNTNLISAYDASRGVVIDRMLVNIEEHPMRGIGFGISSDPTRMQVDRDSLLGLPTGAVIEKGVLPLAVLEELGLVGFLAVFAWLALLVLKSARRGGVISLAVLYSALLINFGESVLFSPGGLGLLILIFVTWAATAPRSCKANDSHG